MTNKSFTDIMIETKLSHRELSEKAAFALGVIRVMQEATAVVLKRYGLPGIQIEAINQQILAEYTRMAKNAASKEETKE